MDRKHLLRQTSIKVCINTIQCMEAFMIYQKRHMTETQRHRIEYFQNTDRDKTRNKRILNPASFFQMSQTDI